MNRSSLTKKQITDKNGKRTFVWVRTGNEPSHERKHSGEQGKQGERGQGSEKPTKEVWDNGRNAISGRSRTQHDQTVSREKAKQKLGSADNVAAKTAEAYAKSAGMPAPKPHAYKKSDAVVQPKVSAQFMSLPDITDGHSETKAEKEVFDSYVKSGLAKKYGIKNYRDLVEKAYVQLGKEIDAQYKALPIKVSWHTGDKDYLNSHELLDDIHNFDHMYVFTGGEDHPLIGSKTKDKDGITINDKFRAVHDFFGHGMHGYQFGKDGEENAWIEHSKMLSDLARVALTTETRGQNSFVNYSGENDGVFKKMALANALKKSADPEAVKEGERLLDEARGEFKFAPQKVVALSQEYTDASQYFGGK